jgi:RND family efflux transporter MFP subunit
MSAWKQIALSLVILVAAAAAWAKFFPGADAMLSRWGMDWAVVALGVGDDAGEKSGQQAAPGRRQGGPQGFVVTSPASLATINDRLQAIGTGRAKASVTVNPFDSGRLIAVTVKSGAEVEAGEIIAELDAESQQIAVDRARVALADAQSRLDRVNALRSSNTVSAVQVTEAELALRNAELALRDAELDLQRRSIVAPIAGIVGIVPVEAGNYVTSQTTIATIDDRSTIIVDFWVPERYATAVKVGAPVTASLIARQGEVFSGVVSAVDNRLDEASRTLRVQAGIDNPQDALRAGMSFQVGMKFAGDTYPAVSPLAVQWGTDGAFVWVVRDGVAVRTPVRIIQRNTEDVLVQSEIRDGEEIVIEGLQNVRDGNPVLVAGRPEAAARERADNQALPATGGS